MPALDLLMCTAAAWRVGRQVLGRHALSVSAAIHTTLDANQSPIKCDMSTNLPLYTATTYMKVVSNLDNLHK